MEAYMPLPPSIRLREVMYKTHRLNGNVEEKRCPKCETWKILEDFNSDKSRTDKLSAHCRVCKKSWRQSNPDKVNSYADKWRAANPEKAKEIERNYYLANTDKVRERTKDSLRKWRAANPEKSRASVRAYQKNNPEKIKEWRKRYRKADPELNRLRIKEWRQANPEKVKIQKNRRRALKYNSMELFSDEINTFSEQYWNSLYGQDCYLCKDAIADCVDHIVPLSEGGYHVWWNFAPICRPCNTRKNNKQLIDL